MFISSSQILTVAQRLGECEGYRVYRNCGTDHVFSEIGGTSLLFSACEWNEFNFLKEGTQFVSYCLFFV